MMHLLTRIHEMVKVSTLLIVLLFGASSASDNDPCKNHRSFGDIRKRLPSNVIKIGKPEINDAYIHEFWYGDVGIEIPTKKSPGVNHCGSIYPIYLKDDVSNSGKEESIPMCIDTGSNKCESTKSIKTKNCGDYNVYYLIRPGLTNAAYCAGPSISAGEYPNYEPSSVDVETTTEELVNDIVGFVFTCKLEPLDEKLWYTVNWYINDIVIYTSPTVRKNVMYETRLVEKTITDKGTTSVGFHVKCHVRASYKKKSSLGLPSSSGSKFIGIEILTPLIDVDMSESTHIRVHATAPIGCSRINPNCNLTVNVFNWNPKTCTPTIKYSNCQFNFNGKNWQQTQDMEVKTSVLMTYGNGITINLIRLRTIDRFIPHPIWQNSPVGEIAIRVRKNTHTIQGKECYAVCDPHMRTFEGTTYEHQYEGVFTLYRNRKYNQEVQVKTVPCSTNAGVYCICGMVVRAGKLAYSLNHCEKKTWTIGYSLCEDFKGLLRVEVNDMEYKITYGSGTKVKASLSGRFINVHVYPSTLDENESDGLCGVLGKPNNEFLKRDGTSTKHKTEFSRSWRVDPNWTLFNQDNLKKVHASQTPIFACNCDMKPDGHRDTVVNSIKCNEEEETNCNNISKFRKARSCKLNSRNKRAVSNHLTDKHYLTEQTNPSVVHTHWLAKREAIADWRNGWTEEKAKTYCLGLFNKSQAVEKCKHVPNVDFNAPLSNCILDIKFMGDTSFSSVAVETIKTKCFHEVGANLTLQANEPGKKSIFQEIQEVACPNECSDHGTCINGTCDCDDNFGGVDCSVDIRIPPLVEHLGNDGLCDLQHDDCTEIAAFGGTFVEAEASYCKIGLAKINDNGSVEDTGEIIKLPVDVESISEAFCILPKTRQRRSTNSHPEMDTVNVYKVSVSNNDVAYSNESLVVIFNSRCQYCTINGFELACSYTGDFCLSGGRCYGNGEPHLDNDCYLCSVNGSSRSWVYSTVSKCNPTTQKPNQITSKTARPLWIIGVVLGAAAMILIAVGGLCYITKKGKRRVAASNPASVSVKESSPPPYSTKNKVDQ